MYWESDMRELIFFVGAACPFFWRFSYRKTLWLRHESLPLHKWFYLFLNWVKYLKIILLSLLIRWHGDYAASNIPNYSLHTLGNHRQLERWNDMYIMHGCCWTLIATGARIKQQNTQTSILYAENLLPTWALNKYALHTMQRTGSLLLRVCLQLTNRYIWINQTQSTLLRKFSIYKLAARSMISIQLSVDIPYVETLD